MDLTKTRARQVRSRDRVRDLAEVFTHQREVDAILDQFPEAFTTLDAKFLEPACGSGNFLVEILRRKFRLVVNRESVSLEQYEHELLRAAASIYGVDISSANVGEARERLLVALAEQSELHQSAGFMTAAACIIHANIVVGDTLNAADQIELCDWQPHAGGRFRRVWSHALVPLEERDLFSEERVQDLQPVHYAELVRPRSSSAERRARTPR